LRTYIPQVAQRYLDYLRDFYLALNARLHENCDMLVDGMRPTHELVEEVASAIRITAFSSFKKNRDGQEEQ